MFGIVLGPLVRCEVKQSNYSASIAFVSLLALINLKRNGVEQCAVEHCCSSRSSATGIFGLQDTVCMRVLEDSPAPGLEESGFLCYVTNTHPVAVRFLPLIRYE